MSVGAVATRLERLPAREGGPRLALVVAVAGAVAGLAASQGGYFPAAWGWASVPLLWTAAIAWVFRDSVELRRAELALLGGLAAFVAWTGLSALWSAAPAASIDEAERALVYVAAVAAVFAIARPRAARDVPAAVLAAVCIIAAFSLATRLLPDRVGIYDRTGVYRLAEPIGYWNGLGLFTVIGAVVATGFAARGRLAARAVGAAALVLLLPTLYFTFSRASWLALVLGLVAAVALDPRRLQYVATLCLVLPAPAVGVLLASREHGLTHPGSALARAAHDGHRIALVLVVLAVVNAAAAVASAQVERHIFVPRRLRVLFAVAVAALAVGGVAYGLVDAGGPAAVARHAYRAFKAPPPHAARDLNNRLLSFSGNGRLDLWRIAWRQAEAHPLLGAGAGMYERYFLLHEPENVSPVRDAHSLFVETLGEVGPIGLALLVVFLSAPFAVLRRARGSPLVPAAAGAYSAFVVHAAVDWDWELPAVTLAGLFCGVAVLLAARDDVSASTLRNPMRWMLSAAAVTAAVFGGITLIANTALSRSEAARERGDVAAATADARRSRSLLPWSPAPWVALGRAQRTAGLVDQAQRSFRKAISIDGGDWRTWYDLAAATDGSEHRAALRRAEALYPWGLGGGGS